MNARELVVDVATLAGLALVVSAIWEVDPILARGVLGGVLFVAGAIAIWRRAR